MSFLTRAIGNVLRYFKSMCVCNVNLALHKLDIDFSPFSGFFMLYICFLHRIMLAPKSVHMPLI